MSILSTVAQKVRESVYGVEVRNSIADGMEKIDVDVENLKNTFDGMVINAGTSNAEIVVARQGYSQLNDKLKGVNGVDVKSFGAKGDGVTDDTVAIQNAINSIGFGQSGIVYFPIGVYLISQTINLKDQIWYKGAGKDNTIIILKDYSNCNLMELKDCTWNADYNMSFKMTDLCLNGNKEYTETDILSGGGTKTYGNSAGHGIIINNTINGIMENVSVGNCAQTGIFFNYESHNPNSTFHVKDVWVHKNNGYGIFIDPHCADMHIYAGDIGANQYDNIRIGSPSSSVRNSTVWGSQMAHGIYIMDNAPAVQIIGNQIEGNSKHGLYIGSSHATVCANKIYDNGNTPQTQNLYSGIFIEGTSTVPTENILISSNHIFSGLYAGNGLHKFAVELGAYHKNVSIFANQLKYQDNGAVNKAKLVGGLTSLDSTDYSWNNSYVQVGQTQNNAYTAGGWIKNSFNTVVTDIETEWDNTNQQVVLKEGGLYSITLNQLWTNASGGSSIFSTVHVGSASYRVQGQKFGTAGSFQDIQSTLVIRANKNDAIWTESFCSVADSLVGGTNYNYMIVARIG